MILHAPEIERREVGVIGPARRTVQANSTAIRTIDRRSRTNDPWLRSDRSRSVCPTHAGPHRVRHARPSDTNARLRVAWSARRRRAESRAVQGQVTGFVLLLDDV
jgi:hypothetical protein